ncbi:MAG TPA: hypothetical protein VH724_12905 [Candidatus Angelobacter sp.]|nr:hypothetical protein [Candidatus Angelobacter sp.]
MNAVRFVFPPVLILALASCKPLTPEVTSRDCTVPAVPTGFTRIFIGAPARGGQQTGVSANDPLDGTTADKFDTVLRTIAEGEHPTWGAQKNIAPENLIVCMASGTFQTNGTYDYIMHLGHTQGSQRGFTVEKNWKIHGRGVDRTKLQLAGFIPDQFIDNSGSSFGGGRNVAISTHSENSSGVEVSDLTIDGNHDQLTAPGGLALDLGAIVLRSEQGNHWIHNVNVIGVSGDAGFRNVLYETFAVQIWGSSLALDAHASTGNLIENVTVTRPGRAMTSGSPPGGAMDGIVVNTAMAEIRNNVVEGYLIAYGGWAMDGVWLHDNISRDSYYGFNADSFTNNGVILQSNQFIHPARYGIVMGGGGANQSFSNWSVLNNTIQMNADGSIGIVLQGQVQNSVFTRNTIQSDGSGAHNLAILSYSFKSGLENFNNSFQDNHIDKALRIDFSQDPNFNSNCRFQNRDLQGLARQDFPDNSSSQCH